MDIHYDYSKKKLPNKEKVQYFAQAVHSNVIHLTDIANKISEKSSPTSGDVLNVIDNFFQEVGYALFDSKRVVIDDICTLTAELTSEGVDKPEDLHAKDIRFKGIKVNFTEKFINQFNYGIQLAPIEVRKYDIALGSLDERRKKLIEYMKKEHIMTSSTYRSITGVYPTKAREELLQFVDEGLLVKHGKNNRYYTLA